MTDDERNNLIAQLLAEGQSLSDVQKVLKDEHQIQMTYMELRMLALDLEVNWKKVDESREDPKAINKVIDPNADPEPEEAGAGGGTQVSVSKVVRPGAVMSGEVTFESGARAEWFLDQLGRLGLNPLGDSESPSEEDLQEFQVALQEKLQGQF
jgi:hypothetical protein